MEQNEPQGPEAPDGARRRFLLNAGKFAAVTPPTVALLLSTSLEANALAASCMGKRGNLGLKHKFGGKKGPKVVQKHGHGRHFS